MTPRLLVWLFPFLMVIFEFLMRSGMRDPGAFDFIGPTLGAAALGMILPLTRLSELSRSGGADAIDDEISVKIRARALRVAYAANTSMWVGLPAWMASLSLSIDHGINYLPTIDGVRTSIVIGGMLWVAAVALDIAHGGGK